MEVGAGAGVCGASSSIQVVRGPVVTRKLGRKAKQPGLKKLEMDSFLYGICLQRSVWHGDRFEVRAVGYH